MEKRTRYEGFDLDIVMCGIYMYACGTYEGMAGDVHLRQAEYLHSPNKKVHLCISIDTLDGPLLIDVNVIEGHGPIGLGKRTCEVDAECDSSDTLHFCREHSHDVSFEEIVSKGLQRTLDILG